MFRKSFRYLLLFSFLCSTIFSLSADEITLKDGNKIIGKIINQDRDEVVIKLEDRVERVKKRDIKRIGYNNEISKEKKKIEPLKKEATSSEKPSLSVSEETLYTAYNIWFEQPRKKKPAKIVCRNYRQGSLLPAGTPVHSITFRYGKNSYILFSSEKWSFILYFQKKYHPNMNMEQFKDRLFTKESFKKLTQGFSSKEINAIEAGKIENGMSKQAVIVAYGYPPENVTPSTEENHWTYWISRFRKEVVEFDERGQVK